MCDLVKPFTTMSMISEVEWKRSFKKHFRRSLQSKNSHFRFAVSCALLGIKPVHLVDNLPPDPHKLQQLLQEVLQPCDFASKSCEQRITSHDQTSHCPQLCILAIEQDVLLLNYTALKVSRVCGFLLTPRPVFIDITRGILKPKVIDENDIHQIEQSFLDCIEKSILSLESESSKLNGEHIPVIHHCCHGDHAGGHGTEVNLCSLFGQLLGYPVVYWFDTSKGYSLDMEKLVQHCVVARIEKVGPSNEGKMQVLTVVGVH